MTDMEPIDLDLPSRADHVEIYKDNAGQWRWRRKAPNGETIADSSEGYDKKTHALNMAIRVNAKPCWFEMPDD